MSQIPSTPQDPTGSTGLPSIPTPESLPAPPSMDTPAGDETPAATPDVQPTSLDALGSYFGVESGGDQDAASAAMLPAIQKLVDVGRTASQAPQQPTYQQQPTHQQQPTQQQQNPEQAPAPLDIDNTDFGDASPEVIKAFKAIHSEQKATLDAVRAQAEQSRLQAQETQQAYDNFQNQQVAGQEQEVFTRANTFLDKLASPEYGVGANRTMIQTIATQQVMETAGNLIRGMQTYGGKTPTIESVMEAAIMLVKGPPAPADPLPNQVPNLQQRGAPGAAAPPAVRGSGSSGAGSQMMNDNDFMAGARAIMAG